MKSGTFFAHSDYIVTYNDVKEKHQALAIFMATQHFSTVHCIDG